MTFLPAACTRALRTPLLVSSFLALVSAAFVSGCTDNHIGRPCDIGVDKSKSDVTKVTSNPAALECPSRLCLLPAQNGPSTGNVAGLCTAECNSDDDCSDAEKGSPGPENRRCLAGFSCRVLVPKDVSTNPIACKPLCVCNDFLSAADRMKATKPVSCP